MTTERNTDSISFQAHGNRSVTGAFDGGHLSSDGGLILLRELEGRLGILNRFSRCFNDFRNPGMIEHSVGELVKQRTFALIQGYEDLNDHDELRRDPLLAMTCGKEDLTGEQRVRPRDLGIPLAGKSTLNRFELSAAEGGPGHRYKKIPLNSKKADELLVELFLESLSVAPETLVLDLDATGALLHGRQEGAFFNAYYDGYCYLPFFIFAGDHLLLARLETSDQDPASANMDDIEWLLKILLKRLPRTRIILRGDGGFCRDELMCVCEGRNRVHYLFGLPKNQRLEQFIAAEMVESKSAFEESRETERRWKAFDYQTKDSWGRSRRVIGKAEHSAQGANPRFLVTSLKVRQMDAQSLYEDLYCARGNMENRIKEQQMGLFSDRLSTEFISSNQLRLYFSAFGYVLLNSLRSLALRGTPLAQAQCWTIRDRLLKMAAQLKLSVRRVKLSWPSATPHKEMFTTIMANIRSIPLRC